MAWARDPKHRRCHAAGPDYAIVTTYGSGTFYVTMEMAARLSARLDRWWMPRWLRLVDVAGRRVWIRGREVESIEENTAGQRLRMRDFHDACARERRASGLHCEDDDAPDPPGGGLRLAT